MKHIDTFLRFKAAPLPAGWHKHKKKTRVTTDLEQARPRGSGVIKGVIVLKYSELQISNRIWRPRPRSGCAESRVDASIAAIDFYRPRGGRRARHQETYFRAFFSGFAGAGYDTSCGGHLLL